MDRKLKIAYAGRISSKSWKNAEIGWDEFCRKMAVPRRTPETVAEYHAMGREERNAVKDGQCYVLGQLDGPRRLGAKVVCRSGAALDGDRLDPGFLEKFKSGFPYAALVHSSHSSLPDALRARILIPFTRDATPEEHGAISRYLAAELGIAQFDYHSFLPNHAMFAPSAPKDGEYVYEVLGGPWLDPDEFLSRHPDWRDLSSLPTAPDEDGTRPADGRKPEDPLAKDGVVGAFCRTYGVEDAIEKFLPKVYEPADKPGRYTYIPGEGKAGLAIFDGGRFAYSFHATDPAGGRCRNAFDLVRIHKFGNEDEKESFRRMCDFAENDEKVCGALAAERAERAKRDFAEIASSWEEPIPLGKYKLLPFPAEALPPEIGDYVLAQAESLQVPADMPGCSALAAIATAMQGKFVVRGKADWVEPVNLFLAYIGRSSERKSASLHGAAEPLGAYEKEQNTKNAAEVEQSRMMKRILEREQRALEEQVSKGKAAEGDIGEIAGRIAEFREARPLRLYVDDITPEKLVSVLAENGGRMALLSSEAGIFDTLAGAYSKSVNIDVMLKSYSGDEIRVDRIGRDSEAVRSPALTILVMAQPDVISRVLTNSTFRGRGLTARFLYSMPTSLVGGRKYRSAPVPGETYRAYDLRITNILKDERPDGPEEIALSPEADGLLGDFAEELEPKLAGEYAEMADWCGKLVGNTLRIAGLLCRAGTCRGHELAGRDPEPLVVDGPTMANAIRLGRYFLSHAQAVFDVIPEDTMYRKAARILEMIAEKGLRRFSRRDVMRNCRALQTAEETQPVLDFLEDYGYIALENAEKFCGKGRPPMPRYLVNPWMEEHYCHARRQTVAEGPDSNRRGKRRK